MMNIPEMPLVMGFDTPEEDQKVFNRHWGEISPTQVVPTEKLDPADLKGIEEVEKIDKTVEASMARDRQQSQQPSGEHVPTAAELQGVALSEDTGTETMQLPSVPHSAPSQSQLAASLTEVDPTDDHSILADKVNSAFQKRTTVSRKTSATAVPASSDTPKDSQTGTELHHEIVAKPHRAVHEVTLTKTGAHSEAPVKKSDVQPKDAALVSGNRRPVVKKPARESEKQQSAKSQPDNKSESKHHEDASSADVKKPGVLFGQRHPQDLAEALHDVPHAPAPAALVEVKAGTPLLRRESDKIANGNLAPRCPDTKIVQCTSVMPAHENSCEQYYMSDDGEHVICGIEYIYSNAKGHDVWTGRCFNQAGGKGCVEMMPTR